MPSARWLLLLLQVLVQTTEATSAASSSSSSSAIQGTPDGAFWYDWGWYGLHPEQHYESSGATPPRPYILQSDARCDQDDRYVFVSPRGISVSMPGPMMYDARGNLVWMDPHRGQVMNTQVQQYCGEDYITFWHGTDNGTFGEGVYYMLNASYEVAHVVRPVGDFSGDLHEFLLTDSGTALITVYQKMRYDLSDGYGIKDGWIFDSLFQEVDVATGALVFQWRASDHFQVRDTEAPIRAKGRAQTSAFDFFHINSVGKTAGGDYVVSSRYMCAVACISQATGEVLWQLGGRNNNFRDLSGGQATNFHWQHHAVWHAETSELTVFDNGAYDALSTAQHSRGLRIALDVANRTAELVQDYVAPQGLLAGSQGSVQLLDDADDADESDDSDGSDDTEDADDADDSETETVLVGWGAIPAFTEFAADGTVLCDVHLCPVKFKDLGWCKNYRTFKQRWVGRPTTLPSAAMRPKENAVYVSWNGATEVRQWQLQASKSRGEGFADVGKPVARDGFEARLGVPADTLFVRVAALDKDGRVLACSEAVSTTETTVVAAMAAPIPKETLRGFFYRVGAFTALGVAGVGVLGCVLVKFRVRLLARARVLVARAMPARSYQYEALPTTGMTQV